MYIIVFKLICTQGGTKRNRPGGAERRHPRGGAISTYYPNQLRVISLTITVFSPMRYEYGVLRAELQTVWLCSCTGLLFCFFIRVIYIKFLCDREEVSSGKQSFIYSLKIFHYLLMSGFACSTHKLACNANN